MTRHYTGQTDVERFHRKLQQYSPSQLLAGAAIFVAHRHSISDPKKKGGLQSKPAALITRQPHTQRVYARTQSHKQATCGPKSGNAALTHSNPLESSRTNGGQSRTIEQCLCRPHDLLDLCQRPFYLLRSNPHFRSENQSGFSSSLCSSTITLSRRSCDSPLPIMRIM